jgi:NAD(P)-dependent dehydrogenase (short-subunit alcohol dehydrogenase family)
MKTDPQKVALVTGAARGIGKATVERFLQEGFRVVASDILPENDFTNNTDVLVLSQDVSTSESWASVLRDVINSFGRLDILVNNAGIGTLPDVEEEDDAGWQTMLDVNAKSIWLGIKSVVPLMRLQHSGSIVNVSSIFGASGGFGKSVAYHASKGVVSAVTRNAAIRYAPENIRINAVSPGFVRVAREEKAIESAGDEMSKEILNRTPMRRWAEPSEIAGAINFLAGMDATYITGIELFVDGGWMAT